MRAATGIAEIITIIIVTTGVTMATSAVKIVAITMLPRGVNPTRTQIPITSITTARTTSSSRDSEGGIHLPLLMQSWSLQWRCSMLWGR